MDTKTNIDELCSKSGIAKGSFYTFFDSKEKLFLKY
ncbi:TetR/AcrR family transcriptional regulator [Clostridioides difficile]|nr:TetR/AcrR family transcriptional regulator [Clostridioides difficile]